MDISDNLKVFRVVKELIPEIIVLIAELRCIIFYLDKYVPPSTQYVALIDFIAVAVAQPRELPNGLGADSEVLVREERVGDAVGDYVMPATVYEVVAMEPAGVLGVVAPEFYLSVHIGLVLSFPFN